MSIPGAGSPLFLSAVAAEAAAFQVDRSLRFNSGDTSNLSKTFSSAGNRKTWTWSCWYKRSVLGTKNQRFFSCLVGSNDNTYLELRSFDNDTICLSGYATNFRITDAEIRDPSAWYHLVVACDTTQSSNSDRVKLYINGVQQTFKTEATITQDADLGFNQAAAHEIGNAFDGYLAEIHFVDGTQLAASDFGEYDDNNNWNPKDCQSSLTYGTNGFYLKFADNSSAAALGTDSSGNSNTWTVNNIDHVASTSIGLPSNYTADSSTYTGTLSNIETDDTNGITAASSHIDFDLGASYTVGTVTAKFINNQGSASANYRIELHGNSSYSNLLANSATVNSSAGSAQTITHDFGSTSAQYLRFSYQGGGRVGTLRFLSTTGATSILGNPDGDSLIDTPTNYTPDSGNAGGNYCTMNPLDKGQGTQPTFSNGNLETVHTGANTTWASCRGTIGMKSGKFYFEWTNRYAGGGLYGIANAAASTNPVGTGAGGWTWGGSNRYFNGSSAGTGLASNHQVDDVIQIAFDADTGKLWFGRNGTFYDSSWGTTGDPGAGTNNTTSVTTGVDYFPALANLGNSGQSNADPSAFNAGQRPFSYTPPTGFKSLCTTNLPDPTIADGSTAMDVVTYTGNGSTQSISGIGFSPDLVWIKNRSNAYNHVLFDVVRGSGGSKVLFSNRSTVEGGATGEEGAKYGHLSSFNADGFTVAPGTDSPLWVSNNNDSYVSWAWDGGSSTASNTDGSITTNVRANASAGFSIIGYTGNATVGATLGHGLNAAPEFMLFKNREDTLVWYAWHQAIGNTKHMRLNETLAATTRTEFLNSTSPTSSVITIGNDAEVNATGQDIICYAWTSVAGYSSFGSYTGNGSDDGPFVFTGFRPAFLLIKSADDGGTAYDWIIKDSERETFNPNTDFLCANSGNAENVRGDGTGIDDLHIDFLSNGFKIRRLRGAINASGSTLIYAAFGEHPFATARAR